MIQLSIELLQNLHQASFTFRLPPELHCIIRRDQVILKNDQNQSPCTIDLNGLELDVEKGVETESTGRSFKFPYLSPPNITIPSRIDWKEIRCAQGHSILRSDRTFEWIHQSHVNADDINEVIFCHRYCDAHGHQPNQKYHAQPSLDLHAKPIILETIDGLIMASESIGDGWIREDRVECPSCSASLGSFDGKTRLISLNKCFLKPFADDYLSSVFRQCEPGRYIIKVPKSIEGLLLVWILPNEILSGSVTLPSCQSNGVVQYYRHRKLLFTSLISADDPLYNDWKRDFSVTTLLINRMSLDFLFQQCVDRADSWNPSDRFHSLSVRCSE